MDKQEFALALQAFFFSGCPEGAFLYERWEGMLLSANPERQPLPERKGERLTNKN